MLLRVMSFNVRCASLDAGGPHAWEQRSSLNVSVIQNQAPDLIGFQECETAHLLTYQQLLSGYVHLPGQEIHPGERVPSAYNAIFWRSECLTLLASGSFWLSETPDVYSRAWNAASPRLASWAKFRLANGCELLHLNTHLDHVSAEARVRGTELIVQRLHALQTASSMLIMTGDFNCNPDDPVHRSLQSFGLSDAYLATGHDDSEQSNTFHAYGWSKSSPSGTRRRGPMRYDWILFASPSGALRPISCDIIRDAQPPLYPSDHYPVAAEFEVV
ncbi:MAG TPA: endonuclease/exonuclease/phosphatase family protein [Ktedonobacteraceae bacterium]|nr:endonuclease/exonuclease/phosphatase family protein [Ktedonobacteraceae bacterium]